MRSVKFRICLFAGLLCTGCQSDGIKIARFSADRPFQTDAVRAHIETPTVAEPPTPHIANLSKLPGRQKATPAEKPPERKSEDIHFIASYSASPMNRHRVVSSWIADSDAKQAVASNSVQHSQKPTEHFPAPPVSVESVFKTPSHDNFVTSTISESKSTAIHPVNHESTSTVPEIGGIISIDGRTYKIRLENPYTTNHEAETERRPVIQFASDSTEILPSPYPTGEAVETISETDEIHSAELPSDTVLMNLPTALSMVGGDHPAVGFARWRVQEAYAQLDRAEVLWLPSLQAGFSFHRHDGNYQASNGAIVDVNRNSFQYGLGAGATGAGTTPQQGIRAQFHLADAIFQPDIAQKNAWARGHAENAVVNEQLLKVSLAYTSLLEATQQLRIIEESHSRVSDVAKLTNDFAAAGQGLQADADRMRTELTLIEARIAEAEEAVDIASARLAHALSTDADRRIVPMDTTVVPLELVSVDADKATLIQSGLTSRPELKESQALVAAAGDQYRRERFAPFVPSVLLGMSTGGFGGGVGSSINNVDGRYDFDALMTWEIRNFGFGERAARKESEARMQQAIFRKVQLMDDVARQISEACTQVQHRSERIDITQRAIQSAENSYNRNLSRIRAGQGLPLEVLQSVRALEESHRAYADAVIAFNQAQFQLQWALGWK